MLSLEHSLCQYFYFMKNLIFLQINILVLSLSRRSLFCCCQDNFDYWYFLIRAFVTNVNTHVTVRLTGCKNCFHVFSRNSIVSTAIKNCSWYFRHTTLCRWFSDILTKLNIHIFGCFSAGVRNFNIEQAYSILPMTLLHWRKLGYKPFWLAAGWIWWTSGELGIRNWKSNFDRLK